jgi:hypothetical protein
MLYQITIEEVYEVEGKDYPKKVEIYQQQIANVDVSEVVRFLNRGEQAKVGSIRNSNLSLITGTQYLVGDDLNAPKTTC